ncbi:hypothetical protein NECID01_0269 [Nematocida sp. AWRm77]|nr:hypothetical protein NECID01_0269 [Nematocida sp. AWRm77]
MNLNSSTSTSMHVHREIKPSSSKENVLTSEFARYTVSRLCAATGLAFGLGSHTALANMHSARIFLGLREAKDQWSVSKTDVSFLAAKGSGVLSSSLFLCYGMSPAFRMAESWHMLSQCTESALQFRRIYQASQRSSGTEIKSMLVRAGVGLGCDIVETAAFMGGWWKVYLGISLIRLSYSVFGRYGNILKHVQYLKGKYLGQTPEENPTNSKTRAW